MDRRGKGRRNGTRTRKVDLVYPTSNNRNVATSRRCGGDADMGQYFDFEQFDHDQRSHQHHDLRREAAVVGDHASISEAISEPVTVAKQELLEMVEFSSPSVTQRIFHRHSPTTENHLTETADHSTFSRTVNPIFITSQTCTPATVMSEPSSAQARPVTLDTAERVIKKRKPPAPRYSPRTTTVARKSQDGQERPPGAFICEHCNKDFARSDNFIRHKRTHDGFIDWICPVPMCLKKCSRASNGGEHLAKVHQVEGICPQCRQEFTRPGLVRHLGNKESPCHPSRWPTFAPGHFQHPSTSK